MEDIGVLDEDGNIDFSGIKEWFEDKKESLIDQGVPKENIFMKLVDRYNYPI